MKIANSLKTLKKRDKNCRIVRRKAAAISSRRAMTPWSGAGISMT